MQLPSEHVARMSHLLQATPSHARATLGKKRRARKHGYAAAREHAEHGVKEKRHRKKSRQPKKIEGGTRAGTGHEAAHALRVIEARKP